MQNGTQPLVAVYLWGGTRGAFGAPLAPGQIFAQLFITPQARSVQNFGVVQGGVAEFQHAQLRPYMEDPQQKGRFAINKHVLYGLAYAASPKPALFLCDWLWPTHTIGYHSFL